MPFWLTAPKTPHSLLRFLLLNRGKTTSGDGKDRFRAFARANNLVGAENSDSPPRIPRFHKPASLPDKKTWLPLKGEEALSLVSTLGVTGGRRDRKIKRKGHPDDPPSTPEFGGRRVEVRLRKPERGIAVGAVIRIGGDVDLWSWATSHPKRKERR